MKILHVIRSIDPRLGGPPTVVQNLVREQVHLGHEVAILTTTSQGVDARDPQTEYQGKLRKHPSYAGVEIVFARAYGGRRGPFHSFSFSPQQRRWLRLRLADSARRPDLIHLHGTFDFGTAVASRLARRHSIPYLIEPYGMLDAVLFKLRSHFLKKMYMRFVLQDSMRRAAWVHPASDHEVVDIRHWAPAARIKVIPHGADIPDFNAAEAARGFLAKFPQLEGKRVILFLSRVASKKRPHWLVEAVARLRTEHPDLVLLLVGGDGGHMKVVDDVARRLGVEDRVIDGGFLEGDMKHGAFAVAEVFALPSIDENFAIAVVEAMAHGVPALVTPGVASHVYVDAAGAGITVEDNIDSVVAGLRQLLAADGKAIGEKGRRYVEQNLSWESIARQIDSLYQEALAEKAR